jgi:hypothetical protein
MTTAPRTYATPRRPITFEQACEIIGEENARLRFEREGKALSETIMLAAVVDDDDRR